MHLELDDEQVEALRALLDATVRQMSHEIADTDTPSYRMMLRGRRAALQRTLDAVGGTLPNSE